MKGNLFAFFSPIAQIKLRLSQEVFYGPENRVFDFVFHHLTQKKCCFGLSKQAEFNWENFHSHGRDNDAIWALSNELSPKCLK